MTVAGRGAHLGAAILLVAMLGVSGCPALAYGNPPPGTPPPTSSGGSSDAGITQTGGTPDQPPAALIGPTNDGRHAYGNPYSGASSCRTYTTWTSVVPFNPPNGVWFWTPGGFLGTLLDGWIDIPVSYYAGHAPTEQLIVIGWEQWQWTIGSNGSGYCKVVAWGKSSLGWRSVTPGKPPVPGSDGGWLGSQFSISASRFATGVTTSYNGQQPKTFVDWVPQCFTASPVVDGGSVTYSPPIQSPPNWRNAVVFYKYRVAAVPGPITYSFDDGTSASEPTSTACAWHTWKTTSDLLGHPGGVTITASRVIYLYSSVSWTDTSTHTDCITASGAYVPAASSSSCAPAFTRTVSLRPYGPIPVSQVEVAPVNPN